MPDITFDSLDEGDSYTADNSVGLTAAASAAFHGPRGVLTPATASAGRCRFAISTSAVATRLYFRLIGSVPTSDTHLINLQASGSRKASVLINAARKLRLSDATGTTGVWTSAAALQADTWYRLEFAAASGSTTSSGVLRCALYLGDETTPIEAAYNSTTANVDASATFTDLYVGKYSSTAWQIALDSIGYTTGVSALPLRYTPAPATPAGPMSAIADDWVLTAAAGTNAVAALSDGSDATELTSPGLGSNEVSLFRLPPLPTGGDRIWTLRLKAPSGSTATQAKIEILEGATVRGAASTVNLTTSYVSHQVSLESRGMTDFTNLWIRLTGNPA